MYERRDSGGEGRRTIRLRIIHRRRSRGGWRRRIMTAGLDVGIQREIYRTIEGEREI